MSSWLRVRSSPGGLIVLMRSAALRVFRSFHSASFFFSFCPPLTSTLIDTHFWRSVFSRLQRAALLLPVKPARPMRSEKRQRDKVFRPMAAEGDARPGRGTVIRSAAASSTDSIILPKWKNTSAYYFFSPRCSYTCRLPCKKILNNKVVSV